MKQAFIDRKSKVLDELSKYLDVVEALILKDMDISKVDLYEFIDVFNTYLTKLKYIPPTTKFLKKDGIGIQQLLETEFRMRFYKNKELND